MMSSSAMGFLQFQADHSIDRGNTLMTFDFHDEIKEKYKPLSYEIHQCNKQTNGSLDGYNNVTACPCQ